MVGISGVEQFVVEVHHHWDNDEDQSSESHGDV